MDNNKLINQTKYMMGLFSFLGIFLIATIIFTNFTSKGTYSVENTGGIAIDCSQYGSSAWSIDTTCYYCDSGWEKYGNTRCRHDATYLNGCYGMAVEYNNKCYTCSYGDSRFDASIGQCVYPASNGECKHGGNPDESSTNCLYEGNPHDRFHEYSCGQIGGELEGIYCYNRFP